MHMVSSLPDPLGWTKCQVFEQQRQSCKEAAYDHVGSQFMYKSCKLGMMPQKATKPKNCKKNMFKKKSARFTGSPKKALGFPKKCSIEHVYTLFCTKGGSGSFQTQEIHPTKLSQARFIPALQHGKRPASWSQRRIKHAVFIESLACFLHSNSSDTLKCSVGVFYDSDLLLGSVLLIPITLSDLQTPFH